MRNSNNVLTDEVRRFTLTSIPSIAFLEALLLLRGESDRDWNSRYLAKRLYLSERQASGLLNDLMHAGFLRVAYRGLAIYTYGPGSLKQKLLVDQVAELYASDLEQISKLIQSETAKKARLFESAFKWGS